MVNKLLYASEIPVNDKIHIMIPTVGEVCDHEEEYYALVSIFTAMPVDFMVQLDDAGIDFTTINEYELFLLLFQGLKSQDTSMIFGDLNFANFEVAINEANGNVVLVDREHDIVIDRAIHARIASILRKIHHLEKNHRTPANEEAKKFLLKRARDKMRRRKNRVEDSQLETLIIAMVNTEQFKYGYEDVRDLSIYQFNESLRQVVKKIDYDNRMYGVYTGTIDPSGLSQDDLNWLTHK